MAATRLVTAACGAASLAILLAACSGSSSSKSPTGGAVKGASKSTFQIGTAHSSVGNVNWYGDYRPPISLDPLALADYPEETVIPNLCEPLLRVGPNYAITPGLATATDYTDATHLKLTIRSGVKFWDGTPMTATDVAYSLNRNLDPKVASNYAANYQRVSSIVANNPTTVTITFKQPTTEFNAVLATLSGAVVEKAFTTKAGRAFGSPQKGVMCTGPFTYGSFDGTSKLVMNKNPNYWDSAHAPHASSFTFLYPADPSALANAFTSGKVDGGFNVPSGLLSTLKSSTTGQTYVGAAGSTPENVDLLIAKDTGTLSDVRVRQALSMVIDRAGIAKTVYNNTADPLYRLSGPGVWGYAKPTFQAAYTPITDNLDAAKKLIAQAGAAGKSVTLGYPTGDAQSTQITTVIQQAGDSIGLRMKIQGLPNQQYGSLFADAKARKPFDAFLTKSYVELPEPLFQDSLLGGTGGDNNFSGYSNGTVDAALNKAWATTDPTARATLLITAEKELAKDLPAIPIVQPRSTVYLSSKLAGATLSFSFMASPWAAAVGGR
ncbi:ABC transporter substrate-binding protein [uncultured Jatrophihabitans sp.]|uniref:ABC transporter substrate-binding protein n=1 Tax=uncultured Jatrophihabitans sp. TaxID=1610747 RepID=UPI0035CAB4ED